MKHRRKQLRVLAFILTLTMMFGLLSAGTAFADESDENDYLPDGENEITYHVDHEEKIDESSDKLTDEQLDVVNELMSGIQPLEGLKVPLIIDGVTYTDLYDGNSQEAMKTTSSRDLFKKVLTTPYVDGKDVVHAVWVPAAKAALLSNHGSYYKVNGYYRPNTFDQAFEKFDTATENYCGNSKFSTEAFANTYYANTFDEVKNKLIDELKYDASDYIYKGLKHDRDAYDAIKYTDSDSISKYNGDIFYYTFSQAVSNGSVGHGNMGKFYNAFAICFYDFQLDPIGDQIQIGEDESPNVSYKEIEATNVVVSSATNKSSETASFEVQKTDSTTITTSNTVGTEESETWQQEAGIEAEKKFAKPVEFTLKLTFKFTHATTSTTSESFTSGDSKTTGTSQTITVDLPPATMVNVTQNSSTQQVAAAYACPVKFQYKVAVISICGDYSGALPYRTVNTKYAGLVKIFGESGYVNAGDALADVRYIYKNPEYDTAGLVWENGYGISDAALNNSLYSQFGGTITNVQTVNKSSISQYIPIYHLSRTALAPEKTYYSIHLCNEHPDENRLNLGAIDVEGLSVGENGVVFPYYNFDRNKGSWKLCDSAGKIIEKSDIASIETGLTGVSYLMAAKAGTVYLKYQINENTYPVDPQDITKGYLGADQLSQDAIVEVHIYDDDHFEGTLELDSEEDIEIRIDKDTGVADLDLHAVEGLEFRAINEDGTEADDIPSVLWQLEEEYSGCSVTPEGMFIATEPGVYNVQVTYHDAVSNSVVITVIEPEEITGIVLEDTSEDDSPLMNIELDYDNDSDYDLLGDDSVVKLYVTNQFGMTRTITDEEIEELWWDYEGNDGGIYIVDGDIYVYQSGDYQIYAYYGEIQSNPLNIRVVTYEEPTTEEETTEEETTEEEITEEITEEKTTEEDTSEDETTEKENTSEETYEEEPTEDDSYEDVSYDDTTPYEDEQSGEESDWE